MSDDLELFLQTHGQTCHIMEPQVVCRRVPVYSFWMPEDFGRFQLPEVHSASREVDFNDEEDEEADPWDRGTGLGNRCVTSVWYFNNRAPYHGFHLLRKWDAETKQLWLQDPFLAIEREEDEVTRCTVECKWVVDQDT